MQYIMIQEQKSCCTVFQRSNCLGPFRRDSQALAFAVPLGDILGAHAMCFAPFVGWSRGFEQCSRSNVRLCSVTFQMQYMGSSVMSSVQMAFAKKLQTAPHTNNYVASSHSTVRLQASWLAQTRSCPPWSWLQRLLAAGRRCATELGS